MHHYSARKTTATAAIGSLLAALLVVLAGPPARALSPGVHFSSAASSTWQTNGRVWALGQSGGKVVAGGDFTQLVPPDGSVAPAVPASRLAVLDAESGAPDLCQFDVTGGPAPTVRAITTATDGTVYVAGEFGSVNGVATGRVAALDLTTCSVTAFRVPTVSSTVRSLAITGDTLYLGGDFQSVGGLQRLRYAAVDVRQRTVLPFVADVDAPGRAVVVSPDGAKVAIGGDFFNVNGVYSHSIAVVDGRTGANLRTYPAGFIHNNSVTKHIFSGDDGRFYVSNEGTGGGVFDGRLAIDWTTLDQVWRDTCLGATQATYEYSGTLYSASHAHDCSAEAFQDGKRNYFMAQKASDATLLGWDPKTNDGIGEGIGPRALTVATGKTTGKKYLWGGGEFTTINGKPQRGLVRFGPDDVVKPPTPGPVVAEATSEAAVQVRWRTVVDPDDSEITYEVYRNGNPVPVWVGQSSSLWWKRPQVSFVDTAVSPGTTYSYRVVASDGTNRSALSTATSATARAAAGSYASTVRADNPTLYWTGATNGTWVQDAGAGGTATRRLNGLGAKGATTSTQGAVAGDASGSLALDGVDDYVWNDEYAAAPTTWSIETWIKTTTPRGGKIIGYGSGRPRTDTGATQLSGSYDRHLYMEDGGRVALGAYNGSTTVLRTPAALNDGQWHHVVGTQGSGGMQLFVDGRRVATNAVSAAQAYKGVWHVGGDNLNGWPNRPSSDFFAGQVDETAVYPGVLPARRITEHFRAGGGTVNVTPRPTDAYGASVYDDDPSLYWRLSEAAGTTAQDSSYFAEAPGTYGPATTRDVSGAVEGDGAVRTSGTTLGTVATQQPLSPTRVFSAEAWFSTTTPGGKILGFENAAVGNGASYDKMLYMSGDGRLTFGTYNGAMSTVRSAARYDDGVFHHVVATQDAAGTRLYVDGQQVGSNSTSTAETGSGYWRVGGGNLNGWPDAPANTYFAGAVDEFAVYPTALTAAQVSQHFGTGVADATPPTAPSALTASVSGGTVTLGWTESQDNLRVSGYRVYRGDSETFTPSESRLVGESTSTSFQQPAPAPGTYYYRVVAVDGAGNQSLPSSAAAATVADRTPPSAPTGLSATAQGAGGATVTWNGSTDDVAVTGYQVHRGTTADFEVSSATRVGETTSPSFADSGLQRGRYFYKVVAQDAAGNSSQPSDSVAVDVPDYSKPSTPTDVSTSVAGSDVTVSWVPSSDDVGIVGYTVYRGASAGFEVGEASRLADTTDASYQDLGRPAGTSYYKVVARDGSGNRSEPSAAAAATVAAPADSVAPSVPAGVSAAVAGDVVSLSWSPSTDNVGVDGYDVHRGTTADFAVGAGNRVGQVTSTAFQQGGVAAGTYYYKVVARDAAGNTSAASSAARATVGSAPPSQPVTLTVRATEDSLANQAAPTTTYGSNDQVAARGGSSAQEAFMRFAMPDTPSGTTLTGAVLQVRTSNDAAAASTDTTQARVLPGASWTEAALNWNNRPTGVGTLFATLSGTTALNTLYRATGDPTALSPLGGQNITLRLSGSGNDNLRLLAREVGYLPYVPTLTLTYTPGATEPPADSVAPSVPAGVSAAVAGDVVSLSWSPSTDNVGVDGYDVHRGTTADFAVGAGNRVGQVTSTAFQQGGVAAGTYYYKVVARDAAGNTSAASSAARATVGSAPPSQPVTLTVRATEDSLANQAAPTTTYGSNDQVAARGGSSAQEAFMRFAMPDTPSGTTLTGAVLQVRTSNDAAAASTDTTQARVLPGASWTEAALNWNNRPTGVGTLFATLSGTTALNTLYRATGDPTALSPLGGQNITLRLSGSGNDNLRLLAREVGYLPYVPTLTLTYTPE
ncbi:LamG-like jellyroll fold domain-containing protein [Nocardioides aurantiacus]|uniref:LamG-like jellyroll fold domain-containing protein n=1 Tax=Nocardioides aurantiacus TaxID=86796 RepID=UPI001B8616DA|nr:LamG-like jellyroll fold domain-containing protein [Nocardioides aurantiacus]